MDKKALVFDQWIDRDLTAAALNGELVPAFQVMSVIEQAEELLRGKSIRSPVIVGGPGVGKTAVIHELVRRAYAGEGATVLAEFRVVQLSLRAISSQFTDRDKAATTFARVCEALVLAEPPVIPFIPDIHLASTLDWEPTLHRMLGRLRGPFLAESLPRDLDLLAEHWSELGVFLGPIPLQEPRLERLGRLVGEWCEYQQVQGSRAMSPAAQSYAIELTSRFMGERGFPGKVIDLLGQTLDLAPEGDGPVTVRELVARFCQITRVPERLIDVDLGLDLGEVRQFVGERLLGQESATDTVTRMMALIKAGLVDLRRPFGAFLFVGPTGVGKTHCAQLMASYLFDDRECLIHLNMAEYGKTEDVEVLFGSPNANTLEAQRGVLHQRLQGHSFGVLLLDEFEKANRSVHDRFLQMLDEGRFINGHSEVVSVTSLVIIAVSNAGSDVYRSHGLGFGPGPDAAAIPLELDRRLAGVFPFELLNRFDRVVHFKPLQRRHIRAIAQRELDELGRRSGLRTRRLKVEVDADVLDWLVAHGHHPHYGARFLRREIERHVAGTLAEYMVRTAIEPDATIAMGVRRGRLVVRQVRSLENAGVTQLEQQKVTLNAGLLVDEAVTWLARFEPLEKEAEARKMLVERLIDASASRGFWDDPAHAQSVLQRYKTIDTRIQQDIRLLRPVTHLRRVLSHSEESMNENLDKWVDQIVVNYRRWMELGTRDDGQGVWLVLGTADGMSHCTEFLVDLVAMYRGWLRRRGFSYDVVAEEVVQGDVNLLVLEVEGAGALRVLEMEQGEHRRRRLNRPVERAQVWVVPRRDERVDGPLPGIEFQDTKRGRGVAVPRRTARMVIDAPQRGLKLELHGAARHTLEQVGQDLGGLLAGPSGHDEVAREYGLRGGAVQDPRTSASVITSKDVVRGDLEVFFRAWEAR